MSVYEPELNSVSFKLIIFKTLNNKLLNKQSKIKSMSLTKREKLLANLKLKDSNGPLLMEYIKSSKASQSEKFAV